MPMSTVSTICLWLCPLSCCFQRRTAMQGRDETLQSSAASLSAAAYVTCITSKKERGVEREGSLTDHMRAME